MAQEGAFDEGADAGAFLGEERAAGFTYVTLDTEGYRSGSMNALLPVESLLTSPGKSHAA